MVACLMVVSGKLSNEEVAWVKGRNEELMAEKNVIMHKLIFMLCKD